MPGAIQEVLRDIYADSFPVTGYVRTAGPDIEVYLDGDTNAADYLCEVWVPVVAE